MSNQNVKKGEKIYVLVWPFSAAAAKFKLNAIKSVTPTITDQVIFSVKPNGICLVSIDS